MRNINVRNLFVVACVLKVVSALAGWHFNSPWALGFALPLIVMVGYMWLGATRRNDEVSDEKFADSCYYLGFIFTIASISVALMDLPNIGTHIQDIAVRFGAAMLSTVLGLSVRVAMVTFRKDLGDAIHNAEEGVVEASLRFRDQLGAALDRLSSFETAVDQAARLSVERVNLQVENLSRNHADRLAQFFTELTTGNQDAFALALKEVKGASTRLSESVDGYALGMRSNLGSIEAKVVSFSDAVTTRLRTTTFPDDYFAKHLEHPLGRLKLASDEVHGHIIGASETVAESTAVLSSALKKLRDKALTTEAALESVTKLATQQQLLMDGAQAQMDRLESLGTTLQGLDKALGGAVLGFENARGKDAELKDAIRSLIADSNASRGEIQNQFKEVADDLIAATESQYQNFDQARASLQSAAQAYTALATRIESATEVTAGKLLEGANSNLRAADRLATSAAAMEVAAGKLGTVSAADARVASNLSSFVETARAGIVRVDAVVEQLQSIARHLQEAETSARAAKSLGESRPFVQTPMVSLELASPSISLGVSGPQASVNDQTTTAAKHAHSVQANGFTPIDVVSSDGGSGVTHQTAGSSDVLARQTHSGT
jgi:methyl-accepting chemotaxis protein